MATLIAGFGILAAGGMVGGCVYLLRRAPAQEVRLAFRCPCCQQKLRYAPSRAGRTALCPRCHTSSRLPKHQTALEHGAMFVGARLSQHAG